MPQYTATITPVGKTSDRYRSVPCRAVKDRTLRILFSVGSQFGALSISCAPEAGVVAEGTSQQHGSFERTDRGARHIGGPALEIQCLGIATFHQNGSEPLLIGVEELSYAVLHRPWQGRVVGGEHPAQTHSPGFQHVMVELSG